eukprot:3933081-Amphidinium_carterae.1
MPMPRSRSPPVHSYVETSCALRSDHLAVGNRGIDSLVGGASLSQEDGVFFGCIFPRDSSPGGFICGYMGQHRPRRRLNRNSLGMKLPRDLRHLQGWGEVRERCPGVTRLLSEHISVVRSCGHAFAALREVQVAEQCCIDWKTLPTQSEAGASEVCLHLGQEGDAADADAA